jgi:hypothetical protein
MSDKSFIEFLKENKYRDIRFINDFEWVAITPFLFTHAIVKGKINDFWGYDDRWCYHSYNSAKEALDKWSFDGEPEGWHRHPASGRRRTTKEDGEIIEEIRR